MAFSRYFWRRGGDRTDLKKIEDLRASVGMAAIAEANFRKPHRASRLNFATCTRTRAIALSARDQRLTPSNWHALRLAA